MATFSNERRRRRLPQTPASAVAREAASREMESFMIDILMMLSAIWIQKYYDMSWKLRLTRGWVDSVRTMLWWRRSNGRMHVQCMRFRGAACQARVFSRQDSSKCKPKYNLKGRLLILFHNFYYSFDTPIHINAAKTKGALLRRSGSALSLFLTQNLEQHARSNLQPRSFCASHALWRCRSFESTIANHHL